MLNLSANMLTHFQCSMVTQSNSHRLVYMHQKIEIEKKRNNKYNSFTVLNGAIGFIHEPIFEQNKRQQTYNKATAQHKCIKKFRSMVVVVGDNTYWIWFLFDDRFILLYRKLYIYIYRKILNEQ